MPTLLSRFLALSHSKCCASTKLGGARQAKKIHKTVAVALGPAPDFMLSFAREFEVHDFFVDLWVAPAQNADRFTSIVRTMGRDCYCHVYHGYAGWLLVCDAELLDSPPQQRGQLRWDVHASLSLNGCELRTRE